MSDTCIGCGAEGVRWATKGYVGYACGSWYANGSGFNLSESCRGDLPTACQHCGFEFGNLTEVYGHRDGPDTRARECIERECASLRVELAKLRDKLPKTADGVTVTHGSYVFVGPLGDERRFRVWPSSVERVWPVGTDVEMLLCGGHAGEVFPEDCYSTREAAEAARETQR